MMLSFNWVNWIIYNIQLLTGDEGNIWYVGPEDKMLPEAEVNNCFVIPSLVKDNV